jgi:hypothetical protein
MARKCEGVGYYNFDAYPSVCSRAKKRPRLIEGSIGRGLFKEPDVRAFAARLVVSA